MSIEGVALDGSNIPNGRVQRATPRFSRPSIDLDAAGTRVRRDWRAVPVANIVVGDNVPGLGVITDARSVLHHSEPDECLECGHETPAPPEWTVTLTGGDGNTRTYRGCDAVYAFTAQDTPA